MVESVTKEQIGILNEDFKRMGTVVSFEKSEHDDRVVHIVVRDKFIVKNVALALNDHFYEVLEDWLKSLGIPDISYNNTRTCFWVSI